MLSYNLFEDMADDFFLDQESTPAAASPTAAAAEDTDMKVETGLATPPLMTPMPSPHQSFCDSPLDFMHQQQMMDDSSDSEDAQEEEPEETLGQDPWDVQQELQLKAQTLLSKKENKVENFIREFAAAAGPEHHDEDATTTGPEGQSTGDLMDEADAQAYITQCSSQLANASLMLSHKYGSVFKEYLSRQQRQQFIQSYAQVPKNMITKTNLCQMYAACFKQWIHSEHVSFSTSNVTALGGLSAKDAFIFHLFGMATCRRVKGDDAFALSVVGKSSVGKTRMIEHVLQQASFTYASEPGCGRFNVQDRPILLYRDIDIEKLYKGQDASKFRTICRSEMTSVKIHSSTIILPPLWVLVSANQRINNHTFQRTLPTATASGAPKRPLDTQAADTTSVDKKIKLEPADVSAPRVPNAFNWTTTPRVAHSAFYRPTPFRPCHYPSQLVDQSKKANHRQEESVRAVQNRVLECYVRDKPDLTEAPLPNGVIFQRTHLVVGIYTQMIDLLQHHVPSAFYSPVLFSYVLTGLCDNYSLFKKHWTDRLETKQVKKRLLDVISAYVPDATQQQLYLAKLAKTNEKP